MLWGGSFHKELDIALYISFLGKFCIAMAALCIPFGIQSNLFCMRNHCPPLRIIFCILCRNSSSGVAATSCTGTGLS